MSFRRIDCAIGIAVTLVATGSAFAVPGWNVANIDNTTTNPSNANFINLARNPDGPFIIRNEVRPVINYGGGGQYAGDFPFLNEVALGSDQSNFLQRHTGFIQIPVSGVYSLFNQTDDPFFVSIGSNAGPVTWTDTACCGVSVNAVTLTAGTFPIEVIMAEFGGGDNVEFAMAFGGAIGAPLAFNTTTYRLVGDTANGGLFVQTTIPEPATAALGLVAVAGLAMRRRREA